VERREHAVYVFERPHVQFYDERRTFGAPTPPEERDVFLKKYKTKLCVQYGTVMKEYVDVPNSLLEKTRELKKYFDISFAYVRSLKPKPTTRAVKKKAGYSN